MGSRLEVDLRGNGRQPLAHRSSPKRRQVRCQLSGSVPRNWNLIADASLIHRSLRAYSTVEPKSCPERHSEDSVRRTVSRGRRSLKRMYQRSPKTSSKQFYALIRIPRTSHLMRWFVRSSEEPRPIYSIVRDPASCSRCIRHSIGLRRG